MIFSLTSSISLSLQDSANKVSDDDDISDRKHTNKEDISLIRTIQMIIKKSKDILNISIPFVEVVVGYE